MNYPTELMLEVARLYYNQKLSQNEIAQRINLSRPTVSRILKQAEEKGFVKITVVDPSQDIAHLKTRLTEVFGLRDVHIVSSYGENDSSVLPILGKAGADYLVSILKPRDILGVSWGQTVSEIVRHMPDYHLDDLTVVSINGWTYENVMDEGLLGIVRLLGKKLRATLRLLYTPVIASSVDVKNAYMSDSNTRMVMEYIDRSNVVLNGIGFLGKHSMLYQYGYIDDDKIEFLYKKKAIGNICSFYYDINGNPVDEDLIRRTIGISYEQLRKKSCSIGVAAGREKVPAILGALRGKYINILITDDVTAKALLKLNENS